MKHRDEKLGGIKGKLDTAEETVNSKTAREIIQK